MKHGGNCIPIHWKTVRLEQLSDLPLRLRGFAGQVKCAAPQFNLPNGVALVAFHPPHHETSVQKDLLEPVVIIGTITHALENGPFEQISINAIVGKETYWMFRHTIKYLSHFRTPMTCRFHSVD